MDSMGKEHRLERLSVQRIISLSLSPFMWERYPCVILVCV